MGLAWTAIRRRPQGTEDYGANATSAIASYHLSAQARTIDPHQNIRGLERLRSFLAQRRASQKPSGLDRTEPPSGSGPGRFLAVDIFKVGFLRTKIVEQVAIKQEIIIKCDRPVVHAVRVCTAEEPARNVSERAAWLLPAVPQHICYDMS